MALRGPVRESSVLMATILSPIARGAQEERRQRSDPDQQFPLHRILDLAGCAQHKIPSPERKTAGSICRQPFEFRQTSRD
jgi:hypothetical protein